MALLEVERVLERLRPELRADLLDEERPREPLRLALAFFPLFLEEVAEEASLDLLRWDFLAALEVEVDLPLDWLRLPFLAALALPAFLEVDDDRPLDVLR